MSVREQDIELNSLTKLASGDIISKTVILLSYWCFAYMPEMSQAGILAPTRNREVGKTC